MSISEQKLVDLGNQVMCLLSEKTQMPLCAVTVKFTADGRQKRHLLSLGLKDAAGNIWHQHGKGDLTQACNHHLTQISLNSFKEKYQQDGVFDVVYTSIEELQQINLIDVAQINDKRNAAHSVSEHYIQLHSPPTYEGLAGVHQHFRGYLQGECVYYAIALASVTNKSVCAIHIGQSVHYAISHDDGEVEDIWGKRSVSNIVAEFTNDLSQKAVVSSVDPGSIALLKSVHFAQIHKAKSIVNSNPRHAFNHGQPTAANKTSL